MELVPSNPDTVGETVTTEPVAVTSRTLTVTIKVDNTADIDTIVSNLKEFGEVSNVSYYEQTYNQQNDSGAGYIY